MSADLRDRVEELEAENHYLRSILAPTVTLPASWSLNPSQTRLIAALAEAPGALSRDRVRFAVSGTDCDACDRSVDVQVSNARRKLKNQNVVIRSIRLVGLILPPASRAIVREAMAAVAAGTVA